MYKGSGLHWKVSCPLFIGASLSEPHTSESAVALDLVRMDGRWYGVVSARTAWERDHARDRS